MIPGHTGGGISDSQNFFRAVMVKTAGAGGEQIRLQDRDRNSRNARVNATNVNKGNMQIAHGVDRVLRPLDLPPTVNH